MVAMYAATEKLLGELLALVTLARDAGEDEIADEVESTHDALFFRFRDEMEQDAIVEG